MKKPWVTAYIIIKGQGVVTYYGRESGECLKSDTGVSCVRRTDFYCRQGWSKKLLELSKTGNHVFQISIDIIHDQGIIYNSSKPASDHIGQLI